VFNLRSLDLNLLTVFVAIYELGTVSGAADHLALSQSATSHALSRLREACRDDLFVRTRQGLSPTPVAKEMYPAIKQALDALKRVYPDRGTAGREIAATLDNFFRAKYPRIYAQDQALVKTAIAHVQGIYAQNVFPEMKVTWGTYPNDLGHTDAPGCFRCHDGNHSSVDGRTISNDCATCHDLLAVSEKDPKILTDLGLKPVPTIP